MLSFLSIALALSATVNGQLGKPVWSTTGMDPLNDYYQNIPATSSSRVSISTPSLCVSRASGKCSSGDVQAVRVTYSDCGTPWVLCRCANATMSFDTMVYRFGTIPPGVRSYVGAALATAASGASAGSSGDFITFNGDCVTQVFLHEAGHSLDQGTNGGSAWQSAVSSSSCVPDAYANSNYAEDFAQVEVMYNYQLKDGTFPMSTACLTPQLSYM
ncbi:hypothetical protein BKA62DRAFT_641201, partial [Auriculariales sp. MPI-PUGE-AT-0066]